MRVLILCVVMALGYGLWIRLNRRLLGDACSPLNILLVSWIGPLALTFFRFSNLQRGWSREMWIVIGWTTLVLVGTSLAAATRIQPTVVFPSAARRELIREWSSPHLLRILLVLYLVGFAAYLYNEFLTNPVGIPAIAYLRNPLLSREALHRWGKTGGTSIAGLVSGMAPLLIPSLYLASHGVESRKWRRLVWFAIAAYPVMALLKLSRIDVLTSSVNLGIAAYYRGVAVRGNRPPVLRPRFQRVRRRLAIFSLVLAVVPFTMFFLQLRANVDIDVAEKFFERNLGLEIALPSAIRPLVSEGYVYFALPFENLADWLDGYTGPSLPGVGMLRPIYSLLGAGRDLDAQTDAAIGSYRLWPVNTYPFVTLPFFEFGALSIVLVPIIVALLVNAIYVHARTAPTALSLALYLNCMFGWPVLFATNGFAVLTFYLNIGALVGVYTLARVLSVLSQRYRTANAETITSA